MKRIELFAIVTLLMMTSAIAAEDNSPAAEPAAAESVAADEASPAEAQKKPLRVLVGVGFTFGGDKLGTMTYTDGSTDNINAGGGMMLYGGMDYRLNEAISLQGTIGLHFDSTRKAENGEATFSRIPLELLAYYHIADDFRLGGGLRYVSSPKIKGTGIASGANDSFDNTVGAIIEGEYMIVPMLGIKLRHVSEKYRPTGYPVSIDGSHTGVLASVYF